MTSRLCPSVLCGPKAPRGRGPAFVLGLVAFAAATVAYSTPYVFGHGRFEHLRGEASWDAFFPAPDLAPRQSLAAGPSALVALNAAQFRPGQPLAIGFEVQNPLGVPLDLFLGALLPDGDTLILFSSAGGLIFNGTVTSLSALPTQAAPPNFSLNNPGFLQFTFPSQGVPTGAYQVFAVLLRQGALANDQIDPGDVLAADITVFTFSTGPASGALPFLRSPFTSEYPTGNFFDHFYPQQFVDSNGITIAYWGERVTGFDGHQGYDFLLPEGTPLVADADGSVLAAGPSALFFCPSLNRTVRNVQVVIDRIAPNGMHFRSSYQHLSGVDVRVGQWVVEGQALGLSGNTGCSTRPHLHYEVFRKDPATGQNITTDPYGWEGPDLDPWEIHPQGVQSVPLWRDGGAPAIFRESDLPPNPSGSTAPVTLTAFRWMGANDAQNPNNEFVEITLDPRFVATSTFDLTGFVLRNNRGDTFSFPPGFRIQVGRPVRVHTGPGANTDTELFWGLGSGVWDNTRECARLVYPTGGAYRLSNASGACG